jgi:hypothetical protein
MFKNDKPAEGGSILALPLLNDNPVISLHIIFNPYVDVLESDTSEPDSVLDAYWKYCLEVQFPVMVSHP